jgi:hypothetical protein
MEMKMQVQQPWEDAEDALDFLQHAQHIVIVVEDGSIIIGNTHNGFRWLEGRQITETLLDHLSAVLEPTQPLDWLMGKPIGESQEG